MGAKPRAEQFEAWKRSVTEAVDSSGLVKGGLEPVRVEVASNRFAVGRVEREVGAADVDADVAQVERDAVDDVGDRVRGRGVDRDLGGMRVDLDRRADDDHAEVKGADQGGVDGDDRERGAVVGAGQVEPAGCVGRGRRRGRSRRRCGRFPMPPGSSGVRARRSRFRAWPLRCRRRGSRGCRRSCRAGPWAGWPSRR